MLTGINAGKNNQMALNAVAAVSMDMKTNFKECSCRDGKQKNDRECFPKTDFAIVTRGSVAERSKF